MNKRQAKKQSRRVLKVVQDDGRTYTIANINWKLLKLSKTLKRRYRYKMAKVEEILAENK